MPSLSFAIETQQYLVAREDSQACTVKRSQLETKTIVRCLIKQELALDKTIGAGKNAHGHLRNSTVLPGFVELCLDVSFSRYPRS